MLPRDPSVAFIAPSSSPRATFTNWGRTFSCRPLAIFEPKNEEQCELVLDLAWREGRVLRAVGVGHSPSDLACTGDFMLRTTKLNKLLEVNLEKLYVVVQAGITLTDLHVELAKHGLAMRNLGSISDQTLGGIVTTASHGSGVTYPVMSADVAALTLLLADGSRARCSRNERRDLFLATLCGLGATGLILTIQLQVERAFRLKDEQCSRTFDDLIENFDEIVRSAEHVRFWWIAASHTVRCSVVNRTTESSPPLLGRSFPYLNTLTGRFVAWLSSKPVTLIDDSHTIFNVECRYPQPTTEFALPLILAPPLSPRPPFLDGRRSPRPPRPAPALSVRDTIYPGYGRETCWVGIAQYKPYTLPVPYRTLFAKFAAICLAHQGRPHWAKAHHPLSPAALREMYPRYDDFVPVVKGVDGEGVWRNEYVRRQVFGEGEGGGEGGGDVSL
ncbi:L-gulonolactone D-arabinono-1,4-lactone oxidase [Mycena metata]|uniref:D-arabinono-1,4-lactone oxidase n=1 Tax=Mycena metata TaxID=1033252 RepID=A0AAD7NNE7_9AGAR|nr:L-gulonolactone D-arabinono-1,4-lactone oxidase [Mycena metata]